MTKGPSVDPSTFELPAVVKSRLATNINTPGDVLNTAVADVALLVEDPADPGTFLIGGA